MKVTLICIFKQIHQPFQFHSFISFIYLVIAYYVLASNLNTTKNRIKVK